MLKVIATGVVISKGYNGAPALKFGESGNSVRFRFGKKVYDPKAEDNSRWFNMSVKAFGAVCEHIKKMQLKEGAYVNIIGRLDEDPWVDEKTGEKKNTMVVIVDEIEYSYSSGKKDNNAAGTQTQAGGFNQQPGYAPPAPQAPVQGNPVPPGYPAGGAPAMQPTAPQGAPQQGMSGNFTGYEQFGGQSLYDVGSTN